MHDLGNESRRPARPGRCRTRPCRNGPPSRLRRLRAQNQVERGLVPTDTPFEQRIRSLYAVSVPTELDQRIVASIAQF